MNFKDNEIVTMTLERYEQLKSNLEGYEKDYNVLFGFIEKFKDSKNYKTSIPKNELSNILFKLFDIRNIGECVGNVQKYEINIID